MPSSLTTRTATIRQAQILLDVGLQHHRLAAKGQRRGTKPVVRYVALILGPIPCIEMSAGLQESLDHASKLDRSTALAASLMAGGERQAQAFLKHRRH
jgi:hypothetical protein